jgi:hypothetical protein
MVTTLITETELARDRQRMGRTLRNIAVGQPTDVLSREPNERSLAARSLQPRLRNHGDCFGYSAGRNSKPRLSMNCIPQKSRLTVKFMMQTAVALLAAVGVPPSTSATALCTDLTGTVFRAANDPGYVIAGVQCDLQFDRAPAAELASEGAVLLQSIPAPGTVSSGTSEVRDGGRGPGQREGMARPRAERYASLIGASAQSWGHDPALLHAIVSVESAYVADAVSAKGAVGLMQVMPSTARRYGYADARTTLLDPRTNVEIGARHLASLKRAFDGDLLLILASYNAGEQSVINSGRRVPPFPETRAYVRDVIDRYLTLKRCRDVVDCVR